MIIDEHLLDWHAARPCRKASVLLVGHVRISTGNEHIVTLNTEGKIEREGDTNPGDCVVTDNRGQPYMIKAEKFSGLYEIDPAAPTQYRSKNFGIAFSISSALTIIRTDGTKVEAAAGDYIFHSFLTDTVNVIAQQEFANTYRYDLRGDPNVAGRTPPSPER